jgi:hypothetical protein
VAQEVMAQSPPTLEELLKPGFSEEKTLELFLLLCPEFRNISDSSSQSDRDAASRALCKRLGVRPYSAERVSQYS